MFVEWGVWFFLGGLAFFRFRVLFYLIFWWEVLGSFYGKVWYLFCEGDTRLRVRRWCVFVR